MKYLFFFVYIYWLSIFSGFSQTYNIKKLGLEKKLSNSYVIDIAEDKNGYLWFATEEGLNKLDGNTFTSFYKGKEKHTLNLTGNEMNCLLDDPNESILWIGTQRAGLNAFNYRTNEQKVYRHDENNPNSIATDDITDICIANDGNLWVSTYWRGIEYLDRKTENFIHFNQETVKGLPSNTIWCILDDGKGNLYIGHADKGMSILSIKTKEVRNFRHDASDDKTIPCNNVQCLFKDKTGNIWVGTEKGLALFNHDTETFTKVNISRTNNILSHRIYDIKQFNENELWVATEFGGIAIIDLSRSLFNRTEEIRIIQSGDNEYSLNNSTVCCLFQDSHNNIWAGTWGGGVNFLSSDNTLFKSYTYSPSNPEINLSTDIVSAVCLDHKGNLWVGTDGGGINVLADGKRIATYTTQNGRISGNSIQTALCDRKGNLWFGVFYGGIMYYDSVTKEFRQIFPENESTQDVRSLFEDSDGTIWVGTSNGIYQIDRDIKNIIRHINCPDNLIRTVIKDSKKRIWAGSYGGGIFIFSSDGSLLKTFNTYYGFPSNTINQIFEDSQGNIWAGSGEGIVKFEHGAIDKYKVYQKNDGLENTFIWAIIEDDNKNIWFSTNKGISCLRHDTESFNNYNYRENVPIAGFTGRSVCKNRNDIIYFGSTKGLCYFNPKNVLEKKEAPQTTFGKVTILGPLTDGDKNDKEIQVINNEGIKLKYLENSFNVSFSIQDYSFNERAEFAYMLKGLADAWYNIKDQNNITFRNLPPGEYQLLIKTRIRNQEWSEKISGLGITVTPPIWLTWWAKLIYAIIAIGIMYLATVIYKRKLNLEYLYEAEKKSHEQEQELNNERLRFFTNITHELRTPLTLIIGPLEDMVKSNTLSAKDQHRISVIHQSALRLLNLINQILDFRKTETQNKKLCVSKGNLARIVYETGLKYKELNRNPNVLIFIEAEENMILYFDKEIITVILDNLISNSLKYTEKGFIKISAGWITENNTRYAQLVVEDTGYGIKEEAIKHIFERYYQERGKHQASGTGIGLALVNNLVKLHEGEIQIESTVNIGTKFFLKLSAENTYPNALHVEDENCETNIAEHKEAGMGSTNMSENNISRPIILVVEDNIDICDYITDAFTDLFDVKTASNGKEGLEIATSSLPDVIISDVMMPVMNGITMCQKLKADIRTSHIPIILLTAKDGNTDKEEGYKAGADSYLTKPFSTSLLQSRISNLLTQRRSLYEHFSIKSGDNGRNSFEEKKSIISESISKLDKEFLDKITNSIIEGLDSSENIDINMLSNIMCMSSSTLYRKIKALTGLSTNEFIRKIKMQLAEKYLLEGKYTISEIAFKVGINSNVYFRQCFKEEFGMSASDYLKQITGKANNEIE